MRTFEYIDTYEFTINHSLHSISKWESKWKIPFIGNDNRSEEQLFDYLRLSTIEDDIPYDSYYYLSDEILNEIDGYLQDPMTATRFRDRKGGSSKKEIVTSELIYYWMISFGIPMECEHWHINKLMALIKMFNNKNSKPEKRSKKDILSEKRVINDARRKQYNNGG